MSNDLKELKYINELNGLLEKEIKRLILTNFIQRIVYFIILLVLSVITFTLK